MAMGILKKQTLDITNNFVLDKENPKQLETQCYRYSKNVIFFVFGHGWSGGKWMQLEKNRIALFQVFLHV